MKAIGMTQGQRGDLIISTVPARAFKEQYPNATLTLGLNKRYADMAPLFANHESYDSVHFYDAYDNWPSQLDLEYLKRAEYDIIYDPMPKRHNEASWWKTESQVQNACSLYNLTPPTDLQCRLTQWFDVPDLKDYVALNYIGAFYSGYPNAKSYSPQRVAGIVGLIKTKGYKVIVIGDPAEPHLEGTERQNLSYFDSVKTMLGCKAFVGIDSGLTWAASAYSFPTLASYSHEYYGADRVCAIQPVNPNGVYLSGSSLNDISIDKISQKIDNILS